MHSTLSKETGGHVPFQENFKKYADEMSAEIADAGPAHDTM